jgi:hypothetical protein
MSFDFVGLALFAAMFSISGVVSPSVVAALASAIAAGTAASSWTDLVRTVGIAIVGNLIGGVGIVFGTRLAQVRAEPSSESGGRVRGTPHDGNGDNGADAGANGVAGQVEHSSS